MLFYLVSSIILESFRFFYDQKLRRFKNSPKDGNYLKTKVSWYDCYERNVGLILLFNEFYMNETKAYDAELAHASAQRDSLLKNTYALVYILKGKAVLDKVFINDIPIADYVEKK